MIRKITEDQSSSIGNSGLFGILLIFKKNLKEVLNAENSENKGKASTGLKQSNPPSF